MWWKIYFWALLILLIIGSFAILQYAPLTVMDVMGLISEVLLFVGLFSFVFKKSFLNPSFWKILFWVYILFFTLNLLELFVFPEGFSEKYLSFLSSNIPSKPEDVLFAIILYIPALYAVYQLGQGKKKK